MRKIFDYSRTMTRRDWMTGLGGLAALNAMTRSGEAAMQSGDVRPRNSAKAMILINMDGAPSHLDTFDPKDRGWYPADIDFQTGAGGIVLSNSLFPGLLRNSRHLAILRSVSSWEAEHTRGQFYLQTGHPSNPAFVVETPHFGSVIALEKGGQGSLPPFLALNGRAGEGAKFLQGKYEPMAAPANQGGLSTLEHNFFGAQSEQRFKDRFQFLNDLDASLRQNPFDPAMAAHAQFYESARKLMYDPAIVNVFRFNTDDDKRYGSSGFGRACIVARNAIKARNGTVFVTVRAGGWDTHQRMYDRNYNGNMWEICNPFDQGVATLIDDLRESGDLDSTLIVLMGEFGRTPGGLNAAGGRDHHKYAMSVVMAGGGVGGGRVIGSTDPMGDRVATYGWSGNREITTEDLTATFYSALGIDWTKGITNTPSGRKFEYVPYALAGQYYPVNEVFA